VGLLVARPGRVLIGADCPQTAEMLERLDIEVVPIPYEEIEKTTAASTTRRSDCAATGRNRRRVLAGAEEPAGPSPGLVSD
jgi:hypothetical protein